MFGTDVPMLRFCHRCLTTAFRQYAWSSAETLPRITVPHKMQERIIREKRKQSAKKHQAQRKYKGPLLISCKRRQFNHSRGQTYSDFSPEHLASSGWKHSKSKGDYFTINAYQSNPALLLENEDLADNFESLGLHDGLLKGLHEMGIRKPTNIQAQAIPVMLSGQNLMCVAETGSGKTLAYLLPILERIHRYHQTFGGDSPMNTPKAVILVPSRELACQIHAVAEQLAKHMLFVPHVVYGGNRTQRLLRQRPRSLTDLLITTPGVYSKLLTNRLYNMSELQNIVLDEADSLLDDSFNEITLRIIRKMKLTSEKLEVPGDDSTTVGTQMALVGATIPRDLENILEEVVPLSTISKVTTSNIHRLLPHVPQKFVRLGSGDKPEALVTALKTNVRRGIPTLVFCNSTSTCCYLGHLLEENGLHHTLLHANMSQEARDGKFGTFQNGQVDILVSSDVASRGLDTVRAMHVINYDFPNFMSDYIHRVGRVGRVGSQGGSFVLNLVCHKWDVDLLWKIEASARKTTELYNVNANIRRKLEGMAESKQLSAEDDKSIS